MRRFIVIETNDERFEHRHFEIETQIKQTVSLPFTSKVYRCVMFDGVKVKLIREEKFIIGSVM